MGISLAEAQQRLRTGTNRWDKLHTLLSLADFGVEYIKTDTGSVLAKVKSNTLNRVISYGVGAGCQIALERALEKFRPLNQIPVGPVSAEDIAFRRLINPSQIKMLPLHIG